MQAAGLVPASRRAATVVGATAAAAIAADQLSKLAVLRWWPHLVTYNDGVAFSLPVSGWVSFGVLVVLALFVAASWADVRRGGVPAYVAVGAMLGGALGNLVDRAVRGAVLDFIHVWIWPVFNLADVAIVVGTGVLLWYAWRRTPRPTSHPADASHGSEHDSERRTGSGRS